MRIIFLAFAILSFSQIATAQQMTDQKIKQLALEAILENPEIVMQAVAIIQQREKDRAASGANTVRLQLEQDQNSPSLGNLTGDITVVEFFDYNCGYCKRVYPAVIDLLKSDGKIRYIFKEFPILGPDSEASSKLAIATLQHYGNDEYYRLHDVLMTFQGPVNEQTMPTIAKQAGFDFAPLADLIESDAVADHISRMHTLGQTLQITGTPSFVIEDTMLRGYLPLADMQTIVAQVRAN